MKINMQFKNKHNVTYRFEIVIELKLSIIAYRYKKVKWC